MKVSLITTTYNSAETLRNTFDSVLAQTHKDIDYWVIDGCSKDGTLDIIMEYVQKFEGRMHWLSEPDNGIYDAMNKGIVRATGDIVGILNSDDFFTSNDILEKVNDVFEKDNEGLDAVYGDIHFVRPNDLNKSIRYYNSRNFRPWAMRFGHMPAHPSFYARTEVFRKYGYYSLDYRIASDFDMMVRLFHIYKIKAKYLPLDFVTMRTGGVSTNSFSHRLLITKEDAKACKRYGIYSNFLMCSVKYLTKIFEFL